MSEQEGLQQSGGALDPGAFEQGYGLGPVLDADQATVVAVFADADAARACFRNLQARELQVSLAAEDAADEEPVAEVQLRERGMGRGVVLGATVGATAGFLAGTYLVPPGAGTATGTMLTTLAGAGLGSFIGSLADREDGDPSSAAPRSGSGVRVRAWRLEATVHRKHVDEVIDLVAQWKPGELRVE